MSKYRKNSVGERLVSGLTELADDLQSDKDSIRRKYTCRRVRLNLKPSEYTPEEIRETRGLLNLSQAIFAEFLGVSVKTVQAMAYGLIWRSSNRKLCLKCGAMSETTEISPWTAGALCLMGGFYGFWRYSLSPVSAARYAGFVVGLLLTYLVIYRWRKRRGAMWTLETCLSGALLGALAFLNSSAFGVYTPVFGAVLGFLAAGVVRWLMRILRSHDSTPAPNGPDE